MSQKRKYKHTRELIKIALDDCMTQEEIAKVCRVSQPQVSKWKNGQSRATEQQLSELLKRYSHRLQRATKRFYLRSEDAKLSMAVVEGPIVFRYVLSGLALKKRVSNERVVPVSVEREPIGRWLVHQLAGPTFVLVRQVRRKLPEARHSALVSNVRLGNTRMGYGGWNREGTESLVSPWVASADDAARWTSDINPPCTLTDLLSFVDAFKDFGGPEESLTVRFLLRKALAEHGHPIPELETPSRET